MYKVVFKYSVYCLVISTHDPSVMALFPPAAANSDKKLKWRSHWLESSCHSVFYFKSLEISEVSMLEDSLLRGERWT